MTVDYKGHFFLGNHRYCYPLTVVDYVSRYLLACDAYPSNEGPHPRRAFERIFREYGLPRAILSDNGSPFGSPGLGRLSRLSLWWIRLGIRIERIVPGHPEQNGAHERMHRTLKAETTRPPEQTMERQQSALMSSATFSKTSVLMSHSGRNARRRSIVHHRGRIRSRCRQSNMPAISRRGRSRTTA